MSPNGYFASGKVDQQPSIFTCFLLPNCVCRLLSLLTVHASAYRTQRTHRTAWCPRNTDRRAQVHNALIEKMRLAGWRDLTSDSPEKTGGLPFSRHGKETREHAGSVSVENRRVATKGETQHRARRILANAGQGGQRLWVLGKAPVVLFDDLLGSALQVASTGIVAELFRGKRTRNGDSSRDKPSQSVCLLQVPLTSR